MDESFIGEKRWSWGSRDIGKSRCGRGTEKTVMHRRALQGTDQLGDL